MTRRDDAGGWLYRWRHLFAYLLIAGLFVYTVQSQRAAAVRLCESGNERTAVLRDFMTPFTAEPDERQFAFIQDAATRAGALESAKRGRAELRDRVARTFTQRDCAAELSAPPDHIPPS